MADWALRRDALGRWTFTDADGTVNTDVVAVRGFPISAPEQGISLLDSDGHELAWIDRLDDLPAAQREAVTSALAGREFMPTITRLVSVSSFATPSTWTVHTDRGNAQFVLRGEEDIRLLGDGALLIADNHGVQYMIGDVEALDRHSRKLLDRFL